MRSRFVSVNSKRFIRRILLLRFFWEARRLRLSSVKIAFRRVNSGTSFSTSVMYIEAPIELIRVTHFEMGMMQVDASPHFQYVRSFLEGPICASVASRYRDYHRRQSMLDEVQLDQKEEIFQQLITLFLECSPTYEILVKWQAAHEVFRVVDGFHRFSILAALRPDHAVPLRVVS